MNEDNGIDYPDGEWADGHKERGLSCNAPATGWADAIEELKRFREDAKANRKAEGANGNSKEWTGFLMGVTGAIHRLEMNQHNT